MGYSYKAAYYSTMQDSITSICKSMLPFSLKKPSLGAAELKLSKLQSDNLKWQQHSFHHILNLIGLHNHGLLPISELHAFRSHLLDTLIASKGVVPEQPSILRDKLLFLQELLYAKCISEEDYHSSKRPLLQRLALQGVELEARDVILGTSKDTSDEIEDQEVWSTIDLKDEHRSANKTNSSSKHKLKNATSSAIKHIKDSASVLGFDSFHELGRNKRRRSIFYNAGLSGKENIHTDQHPSSDDHRNENDSQVKSVLVSEQTGKGCQRKDRGEMEPLEGVSTKGGSNGIHGADKPKGRCQKLAFREWGLDRFKRWKRTHLEDDITSLPLDHNSTDCEDLKESCQLISSPDSPPPPSFIIDKVLGDKIKKELTRIHTQLSSTNPNFEFSDDQMEAICTKLPIDKSNLKHLFPESWCKQYGDLLLDVVKKEVKKHVEENENLRNATLERRHMSSKRWTKVLDDDENCHPNIFAAQNNTTTAFLFNATDM